MSNKFSIAMCTYNGAHHLPEQLASIAAQTRPPDELVVCDDASSDATPEIITAFAASVSFEVSLQINDHNLGSTKNFERAVGLCSGHLIALSDQDDVWLPDKLAQLEAEFDRRPNVGLVFTDAEVIDEFGRPLGQRLWNKLLLLPAELKRLQSSRAIDELLPGSMVTGATMAFRARFKELVLPIPNDLSLIHDGWIAALVAAVSDVLPLSTPLMGYREHGNQQVGPLERRRPGSMGDSVAESVQHAIQRENLYSEAIAITRAVRARLIEKASLFDSGNIPIRLANRIAHFEARSNLPAGVFKRAPRVLHELLAGRYHIYSKGIQSALKDLLA